MREITDSQIKPANYDRKIKRIEVNLRQSRKELKQLIMRDRIVRGVAGAFIIISLLLAIYVNINWLWFTAFVGANLFQSSITKWCLMNDILKKIGFKS